MKKILMILTSHRLDCLKLCMDLLEYGGSLRAFDRVVLLLNGVEGRHRAFIDTYVARHPEVPWDIISGPRGRGERISGLQNQCVERYPDALYFKIDEDTFVSSDWVDELTTAYEAYRDNTDLALVTPVIPNNSAGFHYLLHAFPEEKAAYEQRFPYPIESTCSGTVWRYPQVADWVSRRFLNLDQANRRLRERLAGNGENPYRMFSYRFSINCICYDYRHWQEIGGVQTDDEIGWGEWITENQKLVVLATRALCHHYSFFIQQDWLDRHSLLEDLRRENLPQTLPRKDVLHYHLPRWKRTLPQVPRALRERLMPGSED